MAVSTYKPIRSHIAGMDTVTCKVGSQPFNRDDVFLAFGKASNSKRTCRDGQELSGTGALVFEGEVLEIHSWH